MTTNVLIGRHYRVEILLNNLVDKDVQSIFLPFNVLQAITLCPKYRIKDNFITPNSLSSNISSLIATIIIIFLHIYRFNILYYASDTPETMKNSLIFVLCYYSVGHVIFYINSVRHSNRNVILVLTFQKIFRFLNNASAKHTKRFTEWNWVIVFSILSTLPVVSFIFISYFWYVMNAPLHHLIILTSVAFDVSKIYAIRLLKLFEIKVNSWNEQAANVENFEHDDEELLNQKLFEAFVDIMRCFEIFQTSFRHLVSRIFRFISTFFMGPTIN